MWRYTLGLLIVLLAQFIDSAYVSADFIIGTPSNLGPDINSGLSEWDPSISPDGKSLFYSTGKNWRGGGSGDADLMVATRPHTDAPWGPSESVGPVFSTPFDENQPEITSDGMMLYFSDGAHPDVDHQMMLRPGGMGRPDIWVSKRDMPGAPWKEPENLGATINSPYHDSAPSVSEDGRFLVFGSTRPGGSGGSDIWLSSWQDESDSWSSPENLGPVVNSSGHDIHPEISADGRLLFFSSNRPGSGFADTNLWVTTRDSDDTPWRAPVRLDPHINTFQTEWGPSISQDGSVLFFGRWERASDESYGQDDIWQVPLVPLESITLNGSGDTYVQRFDEALGIDSSSVGTTFPSGWTITDNGIVHGNTTTQSFPIGGGTETQLTALNAGAESDSDRALAVTSKDQRQLQLLAEVAESDAASLRLSFDVEAWDARQVSFPVSLADDPGEAAFDVTVELNAGNGFRELLDLGTVTTGPVLTLPTGDYLDGNAEPNRVSFDSGVLPASIPAGAELRIRWAPDTDGQTDGWVFGLDNVELTLMNQLPNPDLNNDGVVNVGDVDELVGQIVDGSNDLSFDLSANGNVDAADVDVWLASAADHHKFAKAFQPGDSNLDGRVDAIDLNALALNWRGNGGLWSLGDFTADGVVNSKDLNKLALNWRSAIPPTAAAESVPEPNAFRVMMVVILGVVRIRRRNVYSARKANSRSRNTSSFRFPFFRNAERFTHKNRLF